MIFLFLKTSLPFWKPSIVDNLFFKLNERDGGQGGMFGFFQKNHPNLGPEASPNRQTAQTSVNQAFIQDIKMSYIGCTCLASSIVRFQMSPQIVCLKRCIVTLVAFVCLFSIVRFQMCPQMDCLRRCKVTLVGFVWLFSTVCCQMSS